MTRIAEDVGRLLFPASVAVGIAVLVRGYDAAGDGFSAGLLVALGALVQYLTREPAAAARAVGARWAIAACGAGLVLVLATAFFPLLVDEPPLTHLPGPGEHVAKIGAIKVHTALAFDLGVLLVVYGGVVAVIDRFVREPERERRA